MLRNGFLLGKLHVRRSVVALCVLCAAFVAAFHGNQSEQTTWFSGVLALYASSDETPQSSGRAMFESCHICAAITSTISDLARPEHEPVLPLTAGRLESIQPKVTGPPPKA